MEKLSNFAEDTIYSEKNAFIFLKVSLAELEGEKCAGDCRPFCLNCDDKKLWEEKHFEKIDATYEMFKNIMVALHFEERERDEPVE